MCDHCPCAPGWRGYSAMADRDPLFRCEFVETFGWNVIEVPHLSKEFQERQVHEQVAVADLPQEQALGGVVQERPQRQRR